MKHRDRMYPWKNTVLVLLTCFLGTFAHAAEQNAGDDMWNVDKEAPSASSPSPKKQAGTPATTAPIKVSLTESDGYITVLGGLAFNTSFQGGFAAEAGYRFFKNCPRLGVGANFAYNKISGPNQLIIVEGHAEYAFSDENSGLVVRLGLGYGSAVRPGFAVSPAVSYYIPVPVIDNLTVGGQAAINGVFGSSSIGSFSTFLGVRYWF